MIVYVNGINYSNFVDLRSFKVTTNSNYQNTFDVSIRHNAEPITHGMEIVVKQNDDVTFVFGGIVSEVTTVYIEGGYIKQQIKSNGYKNIIARRTFAPDIENQLAGQVVNDLFDYYLGSSSPFNEEFTKGVIDDGVLIERKTGVLDGVKLFNDLALASGYTWWITNDKVFNFTTKPPYVNISRKLSSNPLDVDKFKLLNYPIYKEDLSKYRNRQYVVGKNEDGDQVIGLAYNESEQTRMSNIYGSGVYGSVMYNNNITTVEDANNSALAELNAYVTLPATIRFLTTSITHPNDRVQVNLPEYNIIDEWFVVDKVIISTRANDLRFIYDITLSKHLDTAKRQASWTDTWGQAFRDRANEGIINYNNVGSSGGLGILSATNDALVNLSTTPTNLQGVNIKAQVGTVGAFTTEIEVTPSTPMDITLKLLVGGVEKDSVIKHISVATKTSLSFVGNFKDVPTGDNLVEVVAQCSTGTASIQTNDYKLTLFTTGADTSTEVPEPLPIGDTTKGFGSARYGDRLYEYLVDINIWSQKTSSPNTFFENACASTNNFGYMQCGTGNDLPTNKGRDNNQYNVELDSWNTKQLFPIVEPINSLGIRYFPNSIGIGTKIHLMNGHNGTDASSNAKKYNFTYDEDVDAWNQLTYSQVQQCEPSSNNVNGLIYCVGGSNQPIDTIDAGKILNTYNTNTDSWILKNDIPKQTRQIGSFVIDNVMFVITGAGELTGDVPLHYIYNDSLDSWSLIQSRPNTYACGCMEIGGYGYARSASSSKDFDKYDVSTDSWEVKAELGTFGYNIYEELFSV